MDEPDGDAIATFDWTDFESPSVAVATIVAAETNTGSVNPNPLYEVVEPDSLDSIVAKRGSKVTPNVSVSFKYQGYWVVLKANGRGYLYEQAE